MSEEVLGCNASTAAVVGGEEGEGVTVAYYRDLVDREARALASSCQVSTLSQIQ